MKRLFFLIGYRAVGKTTIGRLLAAELGLQFQDTDRLVEIRSGKTIAAIVDDTGWDGFREIEKRVLQQAAGMDNALVSTGGGAVLHEDVWRDIKEKAGVIWLRAEPSVILARLREDNMTKSQRPSLSDNGVFAEIEEILASRIALYRSQADFTVDTDKMAVDEAVAVIARWCRNKTGR